MSLGPYNHPPRYPLFWGPLLVGLLLASGCYLPFGSRAVETQRAETNAAFERAVEDESHDDILALAERLVDLGLNARECVTVSANALRAASHNGDHAAIETLVGRLDRGLATLTQASPRSTTSASLDQTARNLAERALRETHERAFTRWVGGGTEAMAALIAYTGTTYLTHFPDAIMVADVLWQRAEVLRRSGKRLEAIPLYEEVIRKDFQGIYRDQANAHIAQSWNSASDNTPLPRDVTEEMKIPSPHAEWIAFARSQIASQPDNPTSWVYAVRIAEIQLAYRQVESGYATLRGVIGKAPDEPAVDAASLLLSHAAEHASSSREFRTVRKELLENPVLRANKRFRALSKQLRKRVEGR